VFLPLLLVMVLGACGPATPTGAGAPAAGATSSSAGNALVATATEVAPPASEPTSTQPAAAPTSTARYLGDVAREGDSWALALSVADPAQPGQFFKADAGKKLVGVELVVGNAGEGTVSTNPLDCTLVDTTGQVYAPELGSVDGQLQTLDLESGEKVRGWVGFQVAPDAQPATLKYELGLFGETLSVSLLTPPSGYTPDQSLLTNIPPAPAAGLGTAAEKQGMRLTALKVEDPAKAVLPSTLGAGMRLVAVEILLENKGADKLSANPLYAYLVDDQGYVHSVELFGRDGALSSLDLGAGEKTQGWVSFGLPQGAKPFALKYQLDLFEGSFVTVGLSG
jgi:hypothetical protein